MVAPVEPRIVVAMVDVGNAGADVVVVVVLEDIGNLLFDCVAVVVVVVDDGAVAVVLASRIQPVEEDPTEGVWGCTPPNVGADNIAAAELQHGA